MSEMTGIKKYFKSKKITIQLIFLFFMSKKRFFMNAMD